MKIGCKWHYDSDRAPESDYIVLPWFYDHCSPSKHVETAQALKNQGATLLGHPLTHKDCSPRRFTLDQIPGYLDAKITGFEDIVDHWDVAVESLNFWDYLPDWHFTAFEHMRKRCPKAKLFINEYAILDPIHWQRTLALVERLNERGLIDGVGIQIHTELRRFQKAGPFASPVEHVHCKLRSAFTKELLKLYVDEIKAMDLIAHVAELSVTGHDVSGDTIEKIFKRTMAAANEAGIDKTVIWGNDLWQYQPH